MNPAPADSENPPDYLTATINLSIEGRNLKLEVPAPTASVRPIELLRLFQSVSNAFVELAVDTVEKQGKTISCQKGCGACCRQLVPISPTEARRIHDLVNEMPEPRRSTVRARFDDARKRLGEAGILEKLMAPDSMTEEESEPIGLKYLTKRIPCPFLEDESCSIHPDRPVACREYLVTSPAENCAHPTPETVHPVHMPVKASTALRCMTIRHPTDVTWVPLILAPSWTEAHPDESAPTPGSELVREFFSHITGKNLPQPGGMTT
jgi:Fe-S-cluster containining protein